jgi:hypothetical protein
VPEQILGRHLLPQGAHLFTTFAQKVHIPTV